MADNVRRGLLAWACTAHVAAPARAPVRCQSTRPPSKSYYKRPSKAIERGGGFFVPGMEGARLPVAVGCVSGVLLAVNWAVPSNALHGAAPPTSLAVSTAVGAAGVAGLLLAGLTRESAEDPEVEAAPRDPSPGVPDAQSIATLPESRPETLQDTDELQSSWVTDAILDLTKAQAVVVYRKASGGWSVTMANGEGIANGAEHGAVVDRVGQEGRGLYIQDTTTLPQGIELPCLKGSGMQCAMVEPVQSSDGATVSVVVVGGQGQSAFDGRERAWIAEWLTRFAET